MVNLRNCPCCSIEYELIDLVTVDGVNKCCACVKQERIEKQLQWENVKSVNILKIKDILTEIDNMSVFDKNLMNSKLDDINETWVVLKQFIR